MIEFVAAVPFVALLLALFVQAMILASSVCMVQLAAERAAHGASQAQTAQVVPQSWREDVRIKRTGEHVEVSMRVPSVVPGVKVGSVRSRVGVAP